MKAVYKVNENLSFEVDAETDVDMFRQLAHLQEIFSHTTDPDGNPALFSVRTVEDNEYFEMVSSVNRRIKLQFGQNKKGGGLFPKRIDDDKLKENNLERVKGSWLWTRWAGGN